MINSPLLEIKYKAQQKLSKQAGYNMKKYSANLERITQKVEKKYGIVFKYFKPNVKSIGTI